MRRKDYLLWEVCKTGGGAEESQQGDLQGEMPTQGQGTADRRKRWQGAAAQPN